MRLVRSPNELIFESSSRKERSLQNYQLATCICCMQSKHCVSCAKQKETKTDACAPPDAACAVGRYGRHFVTVSAPSRGILTSQDTASTHACFCISYSWRHFETFTASSNTLKSKILSFLFICWPLSVTLFP